MIDVFGVTYAQLETFFLVLIRVWAMLYVFPIFSAPQIPHQVRFALGALIAIVLFKVVPVVSLDPNFYALVAAVIAQIVLGIIVGFVASLVFVSIMFAGELIDLQIGFAIANVISPTTQQNITIIGEFELAIATLVFLVTDSHHLLIQGIAGSFNLVPLPYINLDPSVMNNAVTFLSIALLNVFKIAAPPAAALFITNVGLSFMARVAPQMNVFVIGFPLQIGVGLSVLGLSLGLLGIVGPDIFHDVANQMDAVMRGLRV
ncbi:MAG: flagellar biosynthetic protein FliR [Candidatus Eremiobacteraeota bacterium]|nr:flagellar biosynthetic protein FliR [Candidatus Eremiobacteraeota bacterium]